MMIARRSAVFSLEKPPTSGSRKLMYVYETSGSIARKTVTPFSVHAGFSSPFPSNASDRNAAGRLR